MHRYLDRFRFFWDLFESEIIRAEPGTPIAMKTKFGYVLSGPMSKVQNNEGSTLICRSLKFGTEICDSDSILQKKSKICGRLNALTLKLTVPPFIKVFVMIFVTIQMKPDMKFDCPLKIIMKFYQIILHITNIG